MVKYGENKGILVWKRPNIRFINKKDKGHSIRNEKENRATEETGGNKHFRSKTAIKESRWATTDTEGIAIYLCHAGVERGGIPDSGGENNEGEEKDGEIRDGVVAYLGVIGSEDGTGRQLR